MNHGGLGHLEVDDTRCTLRFPPELLEHSFMRHKGRMYGIYYRPSSGSRYQGVEIGHDLMLTPIPYRFWPRAARLTLRIKHQPHAIHQISSFLADNDISILQSESTRSGNRYETWSFYIVFEDLDRTLRWDNNRHVYHETYNRLAQVASDIQAVCARELFVDRRDVDMREPVLTYHNTALAYFHHYAEQRIGSKSGDGWLHRPFKLRCIGAGTLEADAELASILNHLPEIRVDEPTVVFAGMDTRYLNIRSAILSQARLHRFIEVSVDYTRHGLPDTCTGLISRITSLFPPGYNIWSSHNRTFECKDSHEHGQIVFLIEDQNADPAVPGPAVSEARALFSTLNHRISFRDERTLRFGEPRVQPVTPDLVQSEIRQQVRSRRKGADVFISYRENEDLERARSIKASLEAAGLTSYVAADEMQTTERFAESIRHAIKSCKEVCVVFTPATLGSEWVLREIHAAWALEKPITALLDGVRPQDLPFPLDASHTAPYASRHLYAREARIRVSNASRD